jgi:hypothetical protein
MYAPYVEKTGLFSDNRNPFTFFIIIIIIIIIILLLVRHINNK